MVQLVSVLLLLLWYSAQIGSTSNIYTSSRQSYSYSDGNHDTEPYTHRAARQILYGEICFDNSGIYRSSRDPDVKRVNIDVATAGVEGIGAAKYGKTRGSSADIYVKSVVGDECKAYRPDLFHKLRTHAGVTEEHYRNCLNPATLECLTETTDSKSGNVVQLSIYLFIYCHYNAVICVFCYLKDKHFGDLEIH